MRRAVVLSWLIACLFSVMAYGARVYSPVEFACTNRVVVAVNVLTVSRLTSVQGVPNSDGWAQVVTNCEAKVAIDEVLRDDTRSLASQDTVVVTYICGVSRQRLGTPRLVNVDAEGNSLYADGGEWVMDPGGEGEQLWSGEKVILGLAKEDSTWRAGAGGFRGYGTAKEIKAVLDEGCAPSN